MRPLFFFHLEENPTRMGDGVTRPHFPKTLILQVSENLKANGIVTYNFNWFIGPRCLYVHMGVDDG